MARTRYYYKGGKPSGTTKRNDTRILHREDGPALEYYDGEKRWFINGKLHRKDGPAIEFADGSKYWCINNNLHREDGPACEDADGSKLWCLNDQKIDCNSNEEFLRIVKMKAFL